MPQQTGLMLISAYAVGIIIRATVVLAVFQVVPLFYGKIAVSIIIFLEVADRAITFIFHQR